MRVIGAACFLDLYNPGWWDAPKKDSDTVISGNMLDSQTIEI